MHICTCRCKTPSRTRAALQRSKAGSNRQQVGALDNRWCSMRISLIPVGRLSKLASWKCIGMLLLPEVAVRIMRQSAVRLRREEAAGRRHPAGESGCPAAQAAFIIGIQCNCIGARCRGLRFAKTVSKTRVRKMRFLCKRTKCKSHNVRTYQCCVLAASLRSSVETSKSVTRGHSPTQCCPTLRRHLLHLRHPAPQRAMTAQTARTHFQNSAHPGCGCQC